MKMANRGEAVEAQVLRVDEPAAHLMPIRVSRAETGDQGATSLPAVVVRHRLALTEAQEQEARDFLLKSPDLLLLEAEAVEEVRRVQPAERAAQEEAVTEA
jgi:enoyl reductase-like protein